MTKKKGRGNIFYSTLNGESSSGRTAVSGTVCRGSNPRSPVQFLGCGGIKKTPHKLWIVLFIKEIAYEIYLLFFIAFSIFAQESLRATVRLNTKLSLAEF